jgi:hypothetical protein
MAGFLRECRRCLATACLVWAIATPEADALAAKPVGYLERGRMESVEGVVTFVSDSEAELTGGRYLRLHDVTSRVFYGVGAHPVLDYWWPAYSANGALSDIITVSAGGLSYLERYQTEARQSEGFARLAWLGLLGGTVGFAGSLIYNALPGNTREVQPALLIGSGLLTALGGVGFVSVTLGTATHDALLDQAIAAYNRDLTIVRNRGGAAR